jgi:ribosome-binding protein aMBF1 (putative translation factor)
VIALSQSIQIDYQEHLPTDQHKPGLSTRRIAEKLGLEERVVREIRCVAERDDCSIDEWEEALRFKDEACRNDAREGISSVTKKYLEGKS